MYFENSRRGPVLRPAGVRARGRPGAGESSGGGSRELWAARGGSVALPERSGKAAGGFGRVPVTVWEVQGAGRCRGGGALAGPGFQVP